MKGKHRILQLLVISFILNGIICEKNDKEDESTDNQEYDEGDDGTLHENQFVTTENPETENPETENSVDGNGEIEEKASSEAPIHATAFTTGVTQTTFRQKSTKSATTTTVAPSTTEIDVQDDKVFSWSQSGINHITVGVSTSHLIGTNESIILRLRLKCDCKRDQNDRRGFHPYRICYEDEDMVDRRFPERYKQIKILNVTDEIQQVEFLDLDPSTKYGLVIKTSDPSEKKLYKTTLCTKPQRPVRAECRATSSSVLKIEILEEERDDIYRYDRFCIKKQTYKLDMKESVLNDNIEMIDGFFLINDLEMYENYHFNLRANFCNETSEPLEIRCKISEPSDILNMEVTKPKSDGKVQITWDNPDRHSSYSILIYEIKLLKSGSQSRKEKLISNKTRGNLDNSLTIGYEDGIKGGKTYEIQIAAVNAVGMGNYTVINVTLPISAPHLSEDPHYSKVLNHTAYEAIVKLKDPFTDRHGPISNYSIMISKKKPPPNCEFHNKGDYYYFISHYPDLFRTENSEISGSHEIMQDKDDPGAIILHLGNGDCYNERRSLFNKKEDKLKICNYKLQSNSTIHVTLIACNSGGCTCVPSYARFKTNPEKPTNVAVIFLVMLIVLLIAGLVLVIVFRKSLLAKLQTRRRHSIPFQMKRLHHAEGYKMAISTL